MKHIVFALALSFASTAFADTSPEAMGSTVESEAPRAISPQQRERMQKMMAVATRAPRYVHQRTKHYPFPSEQVLFCAAVDIDFGIATSGAGCVDADGQLYYLLAGGTGWSFGISGSAFLMYYVAYDKSPIDGVYTGVSLGGSLGRFGGTAGYFARKAHLSEDSVFKRMNSLSVVGYTIGGNFDISATVLTVRKTSPAEFKQDVFELFSNLSARAYDFFQKGPFAR